MRECFHEGNNTFSLLNLNLSVLDGTNLLVEEAVEQTLQALVYLLQIPSQEVLVRIFNVQELAIDGSKDTNTLPSLVVSKTSRA